MAKPAFERDFQQTFTSLYFEWKLLSPPLHETWDFKTTPTLALMNILQTLFHDVWTAFNSLVPLQTPGWRETPWEWGVLSKHKTLAVSWAWARTKTRARPGSSALAILGGHRAFHSLFLLQALKAAASIICVVCGLISCAIWRILYFILYFCYFYFSHLRSSFFQFCRNNASVPYALSQTKKRLIRITNNNTFKKSANIV